MGKATGPACCMLIAVFCGSSLAQQESGTILGTVTDSSGGLMPAVKVTLTSNATGFSHTLTTNSAGTYNAPDLPIGAYSVQAERAGFKTYVQNDVTLM